MNFLKGASYMSRENTEPSSKERIEEIADKSDIKKLLNAVNINNKVMKKAPKGWDSTRIIRYWRENR